LVFKQWQNWDIWGLCPRNCEGLFFTLPDSRATIFFSIWQTGTLLQKSFTFSILIVRQQHKVVLPTGLMTVRFQTRVLAEAKNILILVTDL
jgi:hypothetical protein